METQKRKYEKKHERKDCSKMKFYTLILASNSKLELKEKFEGKIWFSEFSSSQGRVLKMFCTPETAEMMKKYGSVTEYQVVKASTEKNESSHTLIIPITNLLKYNSHLRKKDIYNSVKLVLSSINNRFGLPVEKYVDMHVSILEANEQFSTVSGKVFINIDELCSTDVIATLRELISSMCWNLDINDISGYTHYMQCFYSVAKKQ